MDGASFPASLSSSVSAVLILTGTNFLEWKEKVEFTLGVLDLDLAFQIEKPSPLTETSTDEEKALHKAWEKSDRLNIMFLRMTCAGNIKTSLPKPENVKQYLATIGERFKTADKSLAGTLMADLTTMKFDSTRSLHDHCTEMINLVATLTNMGMIVEGSFLVQFLLNSLPPQFRPFKIHYNTHDGNWGLNNLVSKIVQEKGRLSREKVLRLHITSN